MSGAISRPEAEVFDQAERGASGAATGNGKDGAMLELGAAREITQEIECEVAGAEIVAARQRLVDAGHGAAVLLARTLDRQRCDPVDALDVADNEMCAARGRNQTAAAPFVQAQADGFARDAEVAADILLRNRGAEAHLTALPDSEIAGALDHPTSERDVRIRHLAGERIL